MPSYGEDMHDVQFLTLRVPVRVERPDDPYAVGPGGPAHVDDGGVEAVEDGPAEDGQANSLRDDHLQAGERVLLVARPAKKKILKNCQKQKNNIEQIIGFILSRVSSVVCTMPVRFNTS